MANELPHQATGSGASRRIDAVSAWLLTVAALAMILVIVGGFVRLSRAGLSIVEWDVVTGVVPPIGETAWEESFAEYQQTPEYRLVNEGMTLGEYQYIFYLEWAHRLIARIAGLVVVVPLIVFMVRGILGVRESLRFWGVAVLFGIQGAIGWIMVASGLEDRPVVSDVRLTIHLLAALTLIGITLWMAMDRIARTSPDPPPVRTRILVPLAWTTLAATVIQIGAGGIVAGLKAGHVSNTWPLMFGRWIPSGMFAAADHWWLNFLEPMAAHWTHRWFAFVVAALVFTVVVMIRRHQADDRVLATAGWWMAGLVVAQITLGVLTVLLEVPKWWALTHQAVAMLLFGAVIVVTHRITRSTAAALSAATEPTVERPAVRGS